MVDMSTGAVIALFVIATGVQLALFWWCTRTVIRNNDLLLERLSTLREETLDAFRGAEAEEHARYVADTRSAVAKMNAMADALWSGLSGTVDKA
jgi:hypothetical protein